MKELQSIKKLSKRKKIALICVGSAVLGVGAWVAIKQINKHKAERDAEKRLAERTDNAEENAIIRTISEEKAKSIADALFDAMDGIGTDETEIYNILVVNNKLSSLDIVAIYNAFGVKEYGTFGTPWWGNGEPLDLIGWIKKEMSNSSTEYKLIRAMFNQAGLNFD